MQDYRVYRLNRDGRIIRGEYVAATDDESAIRMVRDLAPVSDCEIWLGNRKIALVRADGETIRPE